jgi:glycerophosphoryl diester phosphodiesterase
MDPMPTFKLSMLTDDNRTENPGRQTAALPEDPFLPSESDRVRVLGHRGAPAPGRPDNSVAAVTDALLQGADGVEVDVWLTADGTLVCTHDQFLHTPTGARLDVGASASSELLGPDGRLLATLPDLLAVVRQHDGARIVVEAKPVTDPAVAQATAEALASVLRTTAVADVTVSSFDPALLGMIRAACADLPVRTALLGDRSTAAALVVRRASEDGHDEVHLPLAGVRATPEAVELARSLGLSVTLWTVNGRTDLQWVAGLGVDAVVTDDVLTAWSELDRAAAVREMVAA